MARPTFLAASPYVASALETIRLAKPVFSALLLVFGRPANVSGTKGLSWSTPTGSTRLPPPRSLPNVSIAADTVAFASPVFCAASAHFENVGLRVILYQIAFTQGDAESMRRHVSW